MKGVKPEQWRKGIITEVDGGHSGDIIAQVPLKHLGVREGDTVA